jgi:sugar (pentulose or hexulose) kinase
MTRLLGIDMGTTTFKAVVYDETGETLAQASVRPPQETLSVRGVAVETWPTAGVWDSICSLTRDVTNQLGGGSIQALSLAELGLVGVPLDSAGRAHESFVTWIDPAVTREAVADFAIDDPTLFSITGNRCSSIYPPVWIRWLSENLPGYASGMARWLNVGDYVVYRLCGEMAIDYSMASQTLCLDQRRLALREDILAAFGLTSAIFPSPGTAGTPLGALSRSAAADTGLKEGTQVVLGARGGNLRRARHPGSLVLAH